MLVETTGGQSWRVTVYSSNDWATVRWRKYDDLLSHFGRISERDGQTDRQTDGRTERIAISISRVSMTYDKNGYFPATRCSSSSSNATTDHAAVLSRCSVSSVASSSSSHPHFTSDSGAGILCFRPHPALVCLSVCLSVCLCAILLKTRAWIWMKCCVSTYVGTWTNWLTFEPDPDHNPDAGTGLLLP